MITKAAGWQQTAEAPRSARMDGIMRAVADWATLEEHDSVLDLFCKNGALLGSLSKNLKLHVCGICDNPTEAPFIRRQLSDADIVYAQPCDIPWRDDAFDAVLGSRYLDYNEVIPVLREAMRVLKPGGQLVLATRIFTGKGENSPDKKSLMRMMEQEGFESVSWRFSGLHGVAVSWKNNSPAYEQCI
ncbi:MAG: hypothetical protein CW338_09740 [Clostridiales bacterium]|nr:hypothetical protein [Clostridiales bacterium]